jgi:hypothetical protein
MNGIPGDFKIDTNLLDTKNPVPKKTVQIGTSNSKK